MTQLSIISTIYWALMAVLSGFCLYHLFATLPVGKVDKTVRNG